MRGRFSYGVKAGDVKTILDILRKHFISGVLVVVPIVLTFIVMRFLFRLVDGILQPVLESILGYYNPGMGILTLILVIVLAGIVARSYIGHRIVRLGERVLARMPIIRPIYSASKQLLEAVATTDKTSFKEVALIEYPRRGIYELCFVSKRLEIRVADKVEKYASCFIPSTPTPVSGFVVMVPDAEVYTVQMSVEEGLKFLVSGGVASPELLQEKKSIPVKTESGGSVS